jgi:uncharacterized protein
VIGIADTGFLVAFANRRDAHFAWAYGLAEKFHGPLLTCEAVLAETAFHLRDAGLVLRFLETGLIQLKFRADAERVRLAELEEQFRDRAPDFADLCLIRMSEQNPRLPILTVDSDFRFYRRNRRDTIPVLMPPGI